jgi:glutathionyl-hydroquinone reductase
VTVPVLWDSQARTIVNNESAEIIRMLDDDAHYRPLSLRGRIDAVNKLVYDNVNNGVYRCGFASSQRAYEKAFDRLFNALDQIEAMLSGSRYLLGGQLTEADWRLFTTLIQWPGIGETVDFEHIKRHYYMSHPHLNPSRIVPKGPVTDFDAPHDRARLAAA